MSVQIAEKLISLDFYVKLCKLDQLSRHYGVRHHGWIRLYKRGW